MRHTFAAAICLAVSILQVVAQDTSAVPEFEVASVKRAELPDGARTHMPLEISDRIGMSGGPRGKDSGRIDYTAISFKGLLEKAYDLNRDRIFGPAWMSSEYYTINAKIPPNATPEQFRLMLQRLLTERFQMTLHRESKEIPVYRLKVAKNGPKLQPGAPPKVMTVAEQKEENQKRGAAMQAKQQAKLKACREAHAGSCASRSFSMDNATVEKFAETLSANLDRPVKDMTGLEGTYAFSLEWAPEERTSSQSDDAPAGRSIFAAIQEQLGLRLESGKESMDLLVVDKAEKEPTSN
ncbi:MAG TPA: TIGR03435 family protein [Bryobacteraceae bacterium]|jgi:uncharacterized protein (TIGR03435 family)